MDFTWKNSQVQENRFKELFVYFNSKQQEYGNKTQMLAQSYVKFNVFF